jgi:hypothetical protein
MPGNPETLPAQPESKAAELVGALLDGGEAIDEGSFTLDPAAAAAKLAEFRYADRTQWPIIVLEALVGLGATQVDVTRAGAKHLHIRAWEVTLDRPQQRLLELHSYAVGQARDPCERALGRLAIGLDMALGGATHAQATLAHGPITITLRGREPAIIGAAEDRVSSGSLWLTLTGAWARSSELDSALIHLCAAVRHAEIGVRLDGQGISQHPREWYTGPAANAEGPGFRVRVGLDEEQDRDGVLELWTAGVCVERRPLAGFASCAVVELDTPRRDLGQIAIVDDATVEQALAAVERGRQVVLTALAQADASWDSTTRPPEWPPARVDRALGRPVRTEQPGVAAVPLGLLPLSVKIAAGSFVAQVRLFCGWLGMGMGVLAIPGVMVMTFAEGAGPIPLMAALATALIGAMMCSPSWQAAHNAIVARDRGLRAHASIEAITRVNGLQAIVEWRFTDHEGRERRGRSFRRLIEDASRWTVGERILVYYGDDQPQRSWWRADVGPPRRSSFTRE